jgi:hypothetical protein
LTAEGQSFANLVAQALGSDDGNLIAYPLVGLEVESQLGVVPLNDDLGGLLDCLCTHATHVGGLSDVVNDDDVEGEILARFGGLRYSVHQFPSAVWCGDPGLAKHLGLRHLIYHVILPDDGPNDTLLDII